MRGIEGEVVMLNLLRFHEVADYSANPELAPDEPISGREAYQKYMAHTLPFLSKSGGEVLFLGEGGNYLIGSMEETWDLVLLVRHKSVSEFMTFASNEEYLAGMGHRTTALQDSRLLPLSELQGNNIGSLGFHGASLFFIAKQVEYSDFYLQLATCNLPHFVNPMNSCRPTIFYERIDARR